MSQRARTFLAGGLALLGIALTAGCASMRKELVVYDPNEAQNRENLKLNEKIVGPIARGYRATVPPQVRERIATFHNNTLEPRIFVNDVLQGRIAAAGRTAGRFVVNSTVGVGGLFDIAGQNGVPQETGDFGQTLYVYGVEDGAYSVSPLLGPSTSRDTLGFIVDTAADPVGLALTYTVGDLAAIGEGGIGLLDDIDKYRSAQESSIDFYSFLRSSYYQTRRAQLREAVGLPKQAEGPASFPVLDKPKRRR